MAKRTLVKQNKNFNDIVYTPIEIVEDIINWVNPKGLILDPWRGGGAFYNRLKTLEVLDPDNFEVDHCEIREGKDFFDYNRKVDYIISNPPYSKLTTTLEHCFKISDNVVLLIPLYKLFISQKVLRIMESYGSYEYKRYKVPKGWTQNFPIAAVWFKKGIR